MKNIKPIVLIFILTIISCSKNGQEFISIVQEESTKDTDNDGITDFDEKKDGTDPLNADTDNDGSNDNEEKSNGTDPTKPDSDNDGVNDGTEKIDGTDPLKPDTDNDGSNDGEEKTNETDPLNTDTDGDGVIDGTEKADNTNPLNNCSFVLNNQTSTPSDAWNDADCDADNYTNKEEIENGTNPLVFDEEEEEIIEPVTPLEVGTWNLTNAIVENGVATTTVSNTELTIPYEASSTNEDVQITLSENPNTIISTGTYTTILEFNVLGTDYNEEISSDSPLASGSWEINDNNLTITSNEDTSGSYEIIELTETTLKLKTEIDRVIRAGGADLDTKGSLIITFARQ